jgi:uncharacterized protein YyaL (SSP411 family)/aryl-alcohol dehydrogenase-like predicted oxidoreductase
MPSAEDTRPANRLIHSTSPYLLQHARNPVDWFPWGPEALERARAEDKPLLLSIGYSACHWCHVMERESFEDEGIAALMNAHFVPVKVDREERPDLDEIYMAATVAMNHGQGGWPMTVFLTPDQRPFYAGTYFPPEDRWGRPGFRSLLARIAELWREDRAGLETQAARLVDHLRENARAAPGLVAGEPEIRGALVQLARDFDARHGGFGRAPKFPPATAILLLLRAHRRLGDEHAREMADRTLEAMADGGIHDHVGGGFCRYSTDERWLVPHFEKMLYDNALLARSYLEGHQATGRARFAEVATETLDYVLREMTLPEGGFCSATDADSEGEEGRFFVWTPAQVQEAVGDEEAARRFCAWYDVTEAGNWEGRSIPHTPEPEEAVAARLGISPEDLRRSVAEARPRVHEARLRRVPPARDDKVLTAWNGLMVGALAEGFRVLGHDRYLLAATRACEFLLSTLRTPEGRLLRTFRAGRAHLAACLEDHAYLAEGLLDLYEAGGDERFLHESLRLAERIRADFAAPEGGFFSTAADHEELIVRHREGHDGATPSANAAAAHVLARLSFHFDRADLRDDAVRALRAYGAALARQPRAFAKALVVLDLLLDGPVELALVGPEDSPAGAALRREVARHYLPNRIVAHHDARRGPSALPLLAGKDGRGGAALYVCRGLACHEPVTEPDRVGAALGAARPGASSPAPSRLAARGLPGRATADGTAAFQARQAEPGRRWGYGMLGNTGLVVSRLGFGGYRVDAETSEHRAALRQALLQGCNLVDTSTNYAGGGSEILVGEVVRELVQEGRLLREEVVVVSKIGYVQGDNLTLAEEREAAGQPFPDMVKYGDGVWHCIHPDFLADQLERSLDRLQLATLDVLLLHNPEYYLSDAHERSHGTLAWRRAEFDRRLGEAFAFLEEKVRSGRIGAYGVSSNTLVRPGHDPEATSLARMLSLAAEAGGEDHAFRVAQLPLNLLESGAVLTPHEGAATLLALARVRDVGVLVNRPLNAFTSSRMVRLAEVTGEGPSGDWDGRLVRLAEQEAEFQRDLAPGFEAAGQAAEALNWSRDLAGVDERLRGPEHWQQVFSTWIAPRLQQALHSLDGAARGTLRARWQGFRARHLAELAGAFREMEARARDRGRRDAARVRVALDPALPPERRGETLSRQALWVAASTPGVSAVLVGMRRPDYVEDAMAVLDWPPLEDTGPAWEATSRLAW